MLHVRSNLSHEWKAWGMAICEYNSRLILLFDLSLHLRSSIHLFHCLSRSIALDSDWILMKKKEMMAISYVRNYRRSNSTLNAISSSSIRWDMQKWESMRGDCTVDATTFPILKTHIHKYHVESSRRLEKRATACSIITSKHNQIACMHYLIYWNHRATGALQLLPWPFVTNSYTYCFISLLATLQIMSRAIQSHRSFFFVSRARL